MSEITGLIFDIKRFAIHDGPGLRTTVFLKGCPLACWSCHNPEGQAADPELLFRDDRCDMCGDCVPVCESGAITVEDGSFRLDRLRCDLCGACVEACMAGALELTGREVTVEELIREVEKDLVYYDQSGGGVTLSGGEPLSQPEFLVEFLQRCRQRDLSVVVDTTGHGPRELLERIEPLVDLFLYDLKLIDGERHHEFTGVSSFGILDNLRWLSDRGSAVSIRLPLVPGVNDGPDQIRALGEFVRALPTPFPVDILPYHRIGVDKYSRLGREYRLPDAHPPSAEAVGAAVEILSDLGLEVTVKGEAYASE